MDKKKKSKGIRGIYYLNREDTIRLNNLTDILDAESKQNMVKSWIVRELVKQQQAGVIK